jgi:hypothetical protein
MSEAELQREVAYLDMLPSAQRKIYLDEVEKARGYEIMLRLRAALVALWKTGR